MMGERDYRGLINNAVESLSRELRAEIDPKDTGTIHLEEIVRCLRRSYYDRTDPLQEARQGFSELLAGLISKIGYGAEPKLYDMGGVSLRASADMIIDDAVILFRPADGPMENPKAGDLMYLNACMWAYGKPDGLMVYIAGNREEYSFSLTRNKKIFEETVRRVRIFEDLLKGGKEPVLEPSSDCERCQYYQRCYAKKKEGKQFTLASMLGFGKDDGEPR